MITVGNRLEHLEYEVQIVLAKLAVPATRSAVLATEIASLKAENTELPRRSDSQGDRGNTFTAAEGLPRRPARHIYLQLWAQATRLLKKGKAALIAPA